MGFGEIIDNNGIEVSSFGVGEIRFDELDIDGRIYYHMVWGEELLRQNIMEDFIYNFRMEMESRYNKIGMKYCV